MKREQAMEIFKALSNDTRLNILEWLKEPTKNFPRTGTYLDEGDLNGGICVSRIKEKAGISQSTISLYLDQMQRAGLVTSVRQGKWTYYTRSEETIRAFEEYLRETL